MRTWAVAAVAVVMAVAGSGCADAPAAPDRQPASDVRVGLVDYDIITPSVAVRPGTVTLQVRNAGRTAHDLRVAGKGTDAHLSTLAPGESGTLRIDVAAGQERLTLWCTLPGHRAQGMETTLPVAGAASTEAGGDGSSSV